MKLEKKSIMPGVFSVGDEKDCNLAGTLEITEAGKIYLDSIHGKEISEFDSREMLNLTGLTSELGKILLIDSFSISLNHKFLTNLSRRKFFSNKLVCVSNDHVGYEVRTSTMTFEIEDMEMWIAKPILVGEEGGSQRVHSYEMPEREVFDLGDGVSLILYHSVTFSKGTFLERSEVKSRAFARFESNKEESLDFFIDKGVSLSNLISFSLDSICLIKNAYYGENEKNRVIFQTSDGLDNRKEINLVNYFFTLRGNEDRSQVIIKNWFDLSKKMRPTISLYNQLKSKSYKFSDAEFLALAQATEALHVRTCDEKPMSQELYNSMIKDIIEKAGSEHAKFLRDKLSYGNEFSFKKRLEMMLSVIWTADEIKNNNKILRDIVDTRNIFTHHPNRGDEKLITEFAYELEDYKNLLEKIIIANILSLISSRDEEWVSRVMSKINSFKFFN